jgi:hypothetical protein
MLSQLLADGVGLLAVRVLLVMLVCFVNGSVMLCVVRYPWRKGGRAIRGENVHRRIDSALWTDAGVGATRGVKDGEWGYAGLSEIKDTCVLV